MRTSMGVLIRTPELPAIVGQWVVKSNAYASWVVSQFEFFAQIYQRVQRQTETLPTSPNTNIGIAKPRRNSRPQSPCARFWPRAIVLPVMFATKTRYRTR